MKKLEDMIKTREYRDYPMYYLPEKTINSYASLDSEEKAKSVDMLFKGGCFNLPFSQMSIAGTVKSQEITTKGTGARRLTSVKINVFIKETSPKTISCFYFCDKDFQLSFDAEYTGFDDKDGDLKVTPHSVTKFLFKRKYAGKSPEVLKAFLTSLQKGTFQLLYVIMSKKNKKYIEETGLGKKTMKGRVYTNRIIHVVQSREDVKRISNNGTIDYRHTFDVCGHWRRVNSIGKNREGEYNVENFTWVNAFKKGSGNYVKKTRVVRS